MKQGRLSIFIPAYNAADTLGAVLARIPEDFWPQICMVKVINDGSRDETANMVKALSLTYPKLTVYSFAKNQGYGKAVRQGLKFCLESGSEFGVCLHADGQYPPEYLPNFLTYMDEHQIDLLQGSRHKFGTARAGGMPFYKILAGKILTWMENLCFDLRLTDFHSGFLMYSRRALESLPFEYLSDYFDFDLEVIASAKAQGLKISEVGIPTRYAGEISYLNPIRYGFYALRVMLKFRLGKYQPRSPQKERISP